MGLHHTTQTARARRGIRNETVEVFPYTQAKSIRQLYCLVVVMICINPQCNFPFHVPLTDAIVTHSGTLELVHLFTRVGAVASVEAHERLMKSVVKAREKQGYFADLTPGKFRVVSIDIYAEACPGLCVILWEKLARNISTVC